MKKKGFSATAIIVTILVLALGGLVTYAVVRGNAEKAEAEEKKRIEDEKLAAELKKIESLDLQSILAPSDDNGQIGDNVYGSKDAKVTLFEYADYQCEYCAMTFPYLSDLVDEYNGKVNLVYRGLVLSYHKNGNAAASAANAAALQGYWHEYAALLFKHQESWKTLSGDKLTSALEEYFRTASNAKGDLEKFRADFTSDRVQQKISFDGAIATKMDIKATPTIYLDDKKISYDTVDETAFKKLFREAIDKKLK